MTILPEKISRQYFIALALTWIAVVSAAYTYCHLHSWVNADLADIPNGANIWMLTRWLFWPYVLPMGFYVFAKFSSKFGTWIGLGVSALIVLAAASLHANGFNNLFGIEENFLGTFYYMIPIVLGTYTLFVTTSLMYVRKHSPEARRADTDEMTIVVNKGRTIVWLKASEIDWMQSARNYIDVHAAGQTYILRNTLAKMADELPVDQFARIHRSYIINRDAVAGINKNRDGSAVIIMKDGSELPCGRAHREALSTSEVTAN